MNTLEKVKAEINHQLNIWRYGSSIEAKYRCETYKELLAVFDTLQEDDSNVESAEQFIKEHTRTCSNETIGGLYESWLTPEQALRAVEIATTGK